MLRRCLPVLCACLLSTVAAVSAADPRPPLALHPNNPHYFLFRGKPTVIVGSAEHYGAVLNLDFDYAKYLNELGAKGLNHTRTFVGAYVEPQGAFKIEKNTLAPAAGRFICPWARSDVPGYPNGGNKFDLTKWDDAYFKRLKDFVAKASEKAIIVEINLFCPYYEEMQWKLGPQNPANNVNGLGPAVRTDVHTLDKHAGLLPIQDAMTRKVVAELAEFDNVYYEICNEPYAGKVPMAWEEHIVDTIVDAEKSLPHRHLISLNIANKTKKIENAHPQVSIFNFHYARRPPAAVTQNYALNKPIGDNETGFEEITDAPYRMEAWDFLLAGGALYSNLDYSFAVGHEDGSFEYPRTQPGGGNAGFRDQMRYLKTFLESFEFLKLKPDAAVVKGGLPDRGRAQALSEPGRQYAIYLYGGPQAQLKLDLPAGEYSIEWLNPVSGKTEASPNLTHPGGEATLASPMYDPDIALRIKRK